MDVARLKMAYKDKEKQREARLAFRDSLPKMLSSSQRAYIALKEREREVEAVKPERAPYVYKPKDGYLYIIHCTGFPYYKIGQTVMPAARVDTLQTGVPFELKLEYALEVRDMNETERKIQQRYKDKCIRGEWFMLTDEELRNVKSDMVLLKGHVHGVPLPDAFSTTGVASEASV